MKTLKAIVARVHGQHKTLFDSALVATGFLIFLLTLPNTAINISAGLDNSYAIAFNYFFVVGAQIGTDILFTYGPLGFLEWPQPQGNNLLYANIIYTVVHLIFVASLLWLGLKGRGPLEQIIVLVLVLFFSYLLPGFMYLKLVFMVGILLLLHFEARHAWLLLLAISLVVLGILIRSTYGILGVVILSPYLLYLAVAENRVKVAISALIGLGVMLAAVWFLIYGNLKGLLPYLIGILEFSSGNSSAMTTNPQNNWILLISFAAIVAYCLSP